MKLPEYDFFLLLPIRSIEVFKVDKLAKYKIHYAGLKEGVHHFEYQLDQEFFNLFEHPLVEGAHIQIHINLDKKPTMMVLDIKAIGTVHVECHRCLEEFEMPLDMRKAIIVKTSGTGDDVDDVEVVMADNENEINVAQHLYDIISLEIPIKIVHPDTENGKGGCDPEILKKMEPFMVKQYLENDPRWDILKNINSN